MPDIATLLSAGPVGAIIIGLWFILPDIKEHLKASAAANAALVTALNKIEPRLANIEGDTSTTREDVAAIRERLNMPAPRQRQAGK
jgi:hypothetical protein